MAHAGEGYLVHLTGLTHDEKGYPVMTAEAHFGDGLSNNGKNPCEPQ